jgi:hypothetical protein
LVLYVNAKKALKTAEEKDYRVDTITQRQNRRSSLVELNEFLMNYSLPMSLWLMIFGFLSVVVLLVITFAAPQIIIFVYDTIRQGFDISSNVYKVTTK